MFVETFEIEEETTEQRPPEEVEAVAVQMIEDLDLRGQKRLLTGGGGEEGADPKTRIPYPRMKESEETVYRAVCSTFVNIEDYDAGVIPLRVLQVAAHARESGMFPEGLQVWHPAVHDPDPILVGLRRPPGRSYGMEIFMLARWGEELLPFEALQEKAMGLIRTQWEVKANRKIREVKAFLASIEEHLAEKVQGEYVSEPF